MKKNLVYLALLFLTSCATMKNGQYQQIAFNSAPQGANIWIDQAHMGTTPTIACLKRSDPHQVRIELEGFKPYVVQLYPTVSGWVFGNILFGGPIGVVVDAVTGSMYKLTPNQLNACLVSEAKVNPVMVASNTD